MYHPRSTPYGDVYTIPTTPIDNIANRLYKEQQIREAKQQQDIKGMDDMFSKNVSGVRDEDIPEIAESYNKWKTAKINLYKNPKSKNRIQEELAAQREMANTFQKIGNSKQMLKTLQENGKRVAAKPDDHTDDAPSLIASTNGVPTSQFGTLLRADPNGEIDPATGKVKMVGFDPADYNTYVDRGNVKNWQPIMKNAIGQLKDVTPISEDYKDDKGLVLGQTVTPIKATASPTSYMANMSQYVYSGVGRVKHFNNSFKDSYTDDNATKIATEYYNQAKNNPLWKQAWCENGLAIPPEALANPNTRVLALNSMEYALNNPPQLGTPKNVPNVPNMLGKKRDESMEDWLAKNKITFKQSMQKIAANKSAGQVPEDLGYVSDNVSYEVGEDVPVRDKNTGQVTTKRFVDITKVDPERLNIIIGRDPSKKMIGAKPTELVVKDANGNPKTLVGYYVDPNTGDWEGAEGQKASREAGKDRYMRSMANTKFKASSGTKGSENTNQHKKIVVKQGELNDL